MQITTTIVYKRDCETLTTETRTFRGRWVADAERKAMQWAEMNRVFPYCTAVRILCEQPSGKTTSLQWLLAFTPRPIRDLYPIPTTNLQGA